MAMGLAIAVIAGGALAWAAGFPPLTVPDGLGVNIHFTGAPARDLDMIQAAGFKFIRMDFAWSAVEREKGVYDFKAYDELTEALAKRGIRALYILDYGNGLYESEQSVRTEDGRQAFARFAAAAAARYRGRGILWELWNEPNWRVRNPVKMRAIARPTSLPASTTQERFSRSRQKAASRRTGERP
jgi:beta-glucosidase/6-phospho-beta-glucosidase/beta-galactosidase